MSTPTHQRQDDVDLKELAITVDRIRDDLRVHITNETSDMQSMSQNVLILSGRVGKLQGTLATLVERMKTWSEDIPHGEHIDHHAYIKKMKKQAEFWERMKERLLEAGILRIFWLLCAGLAALIYFWWSNSVGNGGG